MTRADVSPRPLFCYAPTVNPSQPPNHNHTQAGIHGTPVRPRDPFTYKISAPPRFQAGRHHATQPGKMAHYATSILSLLATTVNAALCQDLFEQYLAFCDSNDLDGNCYPTNPDALKAFCATLGIGKKSRKARNRRRWVNDALSGPARLHAGAAAKAGPPKGPPDQHGRRHYHTLESCRRAGRKSGAVRRFRTSHRDNAVRKAVRQMGLTVAAAARKFGVCENTVRNILKRRPFVKGPRYAPQHGNKGTPTNIIRQTAVTQAPSQPAAAGAAAHPTPTATGPPSGAPSSAGPAHPSPETAQPVPDAADPFVPAQPGRLPDQAPMPPRPSLSRTFIALKLHWIRVAAQQLKTTLSPRMTSIRTGQVKSLNQAINNYINKIAQSDGEQHAQQVRDASQAWLDALTLATPDPVIALLHHSRDTRAKHKPRAVARTKRTPRPATR